MGIGRVELEVLGPEDEGEIGAAHGQAAMAAVCLLHRIDGKSADGIGDEGFDWLVGELGGFLAHRFVKLARGGAPV